MMIRLWSLGMLGLGIAAICGCRNCGFCLVLVFVVGEALLPPPAGPQKYP